MPPLGDGGLDRTVLKLASTMIENGLEVDIVSIKAGGPFLKKVHPSANVIDLDESRALKALPKLISYLKTEQPDAMISAQYYINIIAVWAVRLAKSATKTILTERLATSEDLKCLNQLKKCLMPLFMRWAYKKADFVVAVSKGAAHDLARIIGINADSIKVIYNPTIDDSLFEKANQPLTHPWFEDKGPPVILSVGRLTYQKDYHTLIKAFALVSETIDARLVILGEGEDRSELEDLAETIGVKEFISLPGFVDNPYNYMAKADLFVLSSRFEGMPNVLIEALALSTPVVSTDCPSGPAEILPASALVAMEDEVEMAAKIEKYLQDNDAVQDLLENTAAKLKQFRPERSLESYMELINN